MIDVQKAYISQAIYLAGNELDKRIKYKQELADEIFGTFVSASSQQTNLPDDFDPSQPRLIFQGPKKQIIISQISSQLSMGFDAASRDISEQFEIVLKNSREMHSRSEKFSGRDKLKESALVVTLSFPSTANRAELSTFIHSKFVKFAPISDVASSSVKVGYLAKDNLFLNIEVDVYERREGILASNITSPNDILKLPVVEMGINVKLDINSKPQTSLASFSNEGPEQIIALMSEYFPKHIYQLLGFGE